MEAHVIVHSVFCFTLLCVCVLHSLCVCLEGHSALLHTPRFQWAPHLVWGTHFFHCLPSTVYPPLPALDSSPLFFNGTGARSSVSSAKNNFFCPCACYFPHGIFFRQLKDTVCRVGAWVGCKGFFAGCGGPERTPKHQRVKESEAEGGVVKRGSKGHKLTSSVQMSTLVGLTKFFNILQHNHLSRVP